MRVATPIFPKTGMTEGETHAPHINKLGMAGPDSRSNRLALLQPKGRTLKFSISLKVPTGRQ